MRKINHRTEDVVDPITEERLLSRSLTTEPIDQEDTHMTAQRTKEAKVLITKRSDNFSQWYLDVIAAADLADYSPVKGCMVIKPTGYAIWEILQQVLDRMLKNVGVQNAYFPLFIPESFLKREAEHVKGFSPELAVVTHAGGKKLEEPLVVRPTSETIIYASFVKWIQSWRDLPLVINQWCNVVRWELRTRLFLRTSEFLWQEGHTAHATHEEAIERARTMLDIYRRLAEEYLALPVVPGVKSDSEKFAGALRTYTIESLMQDAKALQCGTSHDLGQNFAKAFGVKFLAKDGTEQYVWQTSWGVSTRLIGALIMMHSDDKGLVLPPKMCLLQVVVVPIWKNDQEKELVVAAAKQMVNESLSFTTRIDDRDLRPAHRYYEWERKGIPIRAEIGPRDVQNGNVVLVRRDTGEKMTIPQSEFGTCCTQLLDEIQKNLFTRAKQFQVEHTHDVSTWEDFMRANKEQGGFIRAEWCGSVACEAAIKEQTKATIRCIPLEGGEVSGVCVYCGEPARFKALFAQSY